ncbi:MAG: chorismate mutase [SAR324 cluster bacterium]|nr:chorismate mutase [SAR324 cluster bacterium]
MKNKDLTNEPLINDLRQSIDHFDAAFLQLLAERMRIVHKIIKLKLNQNIDLLQSDARKEDLKELIEMSVQLKLEAHFFKKILDLVFQDAITQHEREHTTTGMPKLDFTGDQWSLTDLRKSLFNLDKSLCFVLAERFCIVKKIGRYKENQGIPPLDPLRWQQVLDDKTEIAQKLGMNVSLIQNIFNAIHEVALVIEENVKTPQLDS